jgi:translation initiation factor IF-2
MSHRVYDLSKQLNMENAELMTLLKERGYDIRSPSSTIDNISAEALLTEFASRITKPVVVEPVAPAPVPVAPVPERPAIPPMGTVKTAADLERERREREAAEAAAKAAAKAAATPVSSTPSVPAGAPKLPPLPTSRMVPSSPPRPPLPPLAPKYPTMSAPSPMANRAPGLPPPSLGRSPAMPGPASGVVIAPQRPKVAPAGSPASNPGPAGAPKLPPPSIKSAPVGSSAAGAAVGAPPSSAGAGSAAEPELTGAGKVLQGKPPFIVRDFAVMLGIKPFRLISELMEVGIFASMNQAVEEDVAVRMARRHGFLLEIKHRGGQQPAAAKKPAPEPVDESKFLEPRPPVVCVLGHVNHGKTSLLDAIRETNVVQGEAGGITQHTGAYQVEHNKHKITFLDTPGHAAFSKMRERGANLTDIAVLVVAADDGFMPQTDEALQFAQAAGVPVVVAINKTDAKGANIDRVKQGMQQRGITSEDWGGETLCVAISALKKQKIPELLDAILLQAEILELKANPKCAAEGVVVESQVEIGRGATAMVIVEKGTLKSGDALVCGDQYCKVRAMVNDRGEAVKTATPSTPVRLLGWSGAPDAGAQFRVVKNEREAKAEAEATAQAAKREAMGDGSPSSQVNDLNALLQAIHETKQKVFRCIVKGDVHGTVEALEGCLLDLKSEKVSLEVIASAVGPIGQNDIIMASASEAAVVGFNVRLENGVVALAKHKGVRIIQHDIIYELLNQVRESMAELLDPVLRENRLGAAEVRQVFPVAKGFVAGCMVTEGRVQRDGHARLLRKGAAVFTGRVGTLKRFKDDATEVRAGFECGIGLEGWEDYQPGDVIESFEVLKIRATL